MTVADDVREAFSGTRGKVLLFGGAAAVVAYVWWTRSSGGEADTFAPAALDGQDLSPTGDSGVRVPQTDPPVGNQTESKGPGRPENNGAWLAQGVDFLGTLGTPSATAHDALTRALGGLSITTAQQAMVSLVIARLGSPPEGMPPLNTTAPTTSKPLTAPTNLKAAYTYRTGALMTWSHVPGAQQYLVHVNGKIQIARPATGQTLLSGLKPNTRYTVTVTPRANSVNGPSASTQIITKK